jgi:hypothetical protein
MSFAVTRDLAAAAVLLRPEDSILTAISSESRRRYALETLAALRDIAKLVAPQHHLAEIHR